MPFKIQAVVNDPEYKHPHTQPFMGRISCNLSGHQQQEKHCHDKINCDFTDHLWFQSYLSFVLKKPAFNYKAGFLFDIAHSIVFCLQALFMEGYLVQQPSWLPRFAPLAHCFWKWKAHLPPLLRWAEVLQWFEWFWKNRCRHGL